MNWLAMKSVEKFYLFTHSIQSFKTFLSFHCISWLNLFTLAFLSLQAIRVFFMLRSLSLHLQDEPETQLPLTREEDLIKTDDVLDLSE